MGDRFGELVVGEPVVQGPAQVPGQLGVAAQGDQGGDGDQAAVAGRQLRPLPYVGEQHVVGEIGEFRRVLTNQIRCDAGIAAGHRFPSSGCDRL